MPHLPTADSTQSVVFVDNGFSPGAVVVNVGDTITWSNTGKRTHTTTSDTGVWNSSSLGSGGTFAFTFDAPGTYAYHCNFHEEMHGTITVQAVATPTVRPTAAPPLSAPSTPTPLSVVTLAPAPVTTATRNPVAIATPTEIPLAVFASTSVDPILGGMLSTPTGNVVLLITGGAVSNPSNVSLAQPASGNSARLPEGYRLGTTVVQVTAQDSAGLPSPGFAQPAALTMNPADGDLAAVGGDPTNLTLAQVSSDSGIWDILQTTVNDDGSLTAAINSPGMFAVLEAAN